jgi:hypothetical protein
MVGVAGLRGSARQWKKVMVCLSGGDQRRWQWSTLSQLGVGNSWREARWHGRRGDYARWMGEWWRRTRDEVSGEEKTTSNH